MSLFEFRLDCNFECDGVWWLSSNALYRVPGKLKFSTVDGLSLHLGTTLLQHQNLGPSEPHTLHGEIDGAISVTVFDAISGFVKLYGPPTQNVTASGLLVGDHIGSTDESIDRITLRIAGLNDWICEGSFDPVYDQTQPSTTEDIEVHFSVKDNADSDHFVESIPADVSFDLSYEQRGGGHSVVLAEDYIASIRFRQPKSIAEAIVVAYDLELLITLLTGSPAVIDEFGIGRRTGLMKDRFLICHRVRSARRTRRYHRRFMPANYDLVSEQLDDVFNRWFSLCNDCRSVPGLLSTSLFQVISYTDEADFLTLAQAIEAYCRIRSQEKYVSADEFEALSKNVF